MSLRFKIILLFIVLAIFPMLILAGFSYWQARGLLVNTAEANLTHSAEQAAERLRIHALEIDQALHRMASSLEFSELGALGSDRPGSRSLVPAVVSDADYLEILWSDGSSRTLAGTEPRALGSADPLNRPSLMIFTAELPEHLGPGTMRAAFSPKELMSDDFMDMEASLLLIDSSVNRVLFQGGQAQHRIGEGLAVPPALNEALSSGLEGVRTFHFKGDDGARLGSVAPVPGRPWILVATSSTGTVVSSLNRLVGSYWAFVIGLGGFTGLAFSILIGRFTRSLSELSAAAEKIGKGELAPWLPLPTSGEVGQLTVAFNRMLDRVREMMTQVDRSGRLAVVGQLSAYFAHEIRNPLTSVKLNLQRMDRWARLGKIPDFCGEPIEISLREVERLSASVSDVLQLSRSEETSPEPFSLHDLVAETTHLLQSRFERQGVDLRLDLDAEGDRVLARPGQVKSVLLNLMINALEAQPGGGFLEIRSELVKSRDFTGPVVAVRFKDGGPGISPETRSRVFEPFFTTKPNGSGIGLAVASRAVADNHGRLYLEPSLPENLGAEFVMAFPLAPVELEGLGNGDGVISHTPGWGEQEWWKGIPPSPFRDPLELAHPRVFRPNEIVDDLALSRRKPEEMN